MSVLTDLNTPVFAAEGVLHLDRAAFRLQISGVTGGNRNFSMDELMAAFKAVTINSRLTSVSGWSVRADWDGVLWSDFIDAVVPEATARYAMFSSADEYTTCVLLRDLAAAQAMLVWGVGGQPLEDEYGGPLRMVIPNLWGYKSCKWLSRIAFVDKYRPGYWEVRGYSHNGAIEPGDTYDVNTGQRRPISGGEVTDF